MNALILLAEADPQGQVQQIATTFGVDWPHLVAQIISFSIVCFLLYRFAYKPVLAMLEQRRQQIAEGVAEREKIKSQLQQAEAERHRIIVEADAKATGVIHEAHAAAERFMEKEVQKAGAVAEQVIAKAHEAALLEHKRMLEDLKREIGSLVIQATTRVTQRILTAEDQKRLAEETIVQLGRAA